MSYSFNVRGATIAAAVAAVPSKFDEVVASQPVHAADRDAAVAAATALTQLLGEPDDGQEISVSVSGWVQWSTPIAAGEVPETFTGANVSVQANVVAKTE